MSKHEQEGILKQQSHTSDMRSLLSEVTTMKLPVPSPKRVVRMHPSFLVVRLSDECIERHCRRATFRSSRHGENRNAQLRVEQHEQLQVLVLERTRIAVARRELAQQTSIKSNKTNKPQLACLLATLARQRCSQTHRTTTSDGR